MLILSHLHRLAQLLMLLLPVACTLHYTYDVRPYDGKCPANSGGCGTLQQFLDTNSASSSYNKVTLLFQSGDHHLTSTGNNTIISNKKYWILRGQENGITTIRCVRPNISLIFTNIINLTITNIQFQQCGGSVPHTYPAMTVLYLLHCQNITMSNVSIVAESSSNGVVLMDTEGSVSVDNYSIMFYGCNGDHVLYGVLVEFTNITTKHVMYSFASLNYTTLSTAGCTSYVLGVSHNQKRNDVTITVGNIINMADSKVIHYHSNSCRSYSHNHLTISDSVFSGTEVVSSLFDITFEDCWLKGDHYPSQNSEVMLTRLFVYNTWQLPNPAIKVKTKFSVFTRSRLLISDCSFKNNKNMFILKVDAANDIGWPYTTQVLITNTNITGNTLDSTGETGSLISLQHTHLMVTNLVITHTRGYRGIFMTLMKSLVVARTKLVLINNKLQYLIVFGPGSYIALIDNIIFTVANNNVRSLFYTNSVVSSSHPCILQFISTHGQATKTRQFKYSISIKDNKESRSQFHSLWLLFSSKHCTVVDGAVYGSYSYLEIGSNYTIWKNNENKEEHEICSCNNYHQQCDSFQLQTRYPGQTVASPLTLRQAADTITLSVDESQSSCRVLHKNEMIQTVPNNCSEFHYTIASHNNHHCELYLTETGTAVTDNFKIQLHHCPLGFSLNNNDNSTCQCDQILINTSIPISCDINTEMILRPANSWMCGEVEGPNSEVKDPDEDYNYTYHYSENCPFDYCHPQATHIHLKQPDDQCDFNRTGTACGHCPTNLSIIFGSSRCRRCTNDHLIIILPIAIAGMILVLVMFVFNLTIVNGVIGTFILYVNILSINKTLLFPANSSHSQIYVMIALANLDLGMEVCFYDGMDGYVSMWLQLVFPFYLIFIAGLLIISSRYSKLVQRITAQRGLPVLATLFLLSHTKILITACIVLFSYTEIVTITRSGQSSRLVWSVSTDVSLFGQQHAPLFTVNLILLLMLIPFNIVLLFNRQLARFRLVQRFKPLLDPYKAPYQDSYHYWTGYQLVIRTLLLGTTAFSKNNTLTLSTLIIGCVMCIHGYVSPFKSSLLNLQELGLMFNVLTVYVLANVDQLAVLVTVGVAVVYVIIFLLCHCVRHTCGGVVRTSQLYDKLMMWKMTKTLTNSIEMDTQLLHDENWVIGTYEEYREPIMALDD